MGKPAKSHIVSVEGDHALYSDGAVRWAEGNSLGKKKGGLVKPHPKAHAPIRTAEEGREMGRKGNQIKSEMWRSAAVDGMTKELAKKGRIAKDGSPEEGFGAIVGAQAGMAVSDTREATGAARFVAESIGAMTRGGGQVQALQVNVQIGEAVRDRYLDPDIEVVDATPQEAAEHEEK